MVETALVMLPMLGLLFMILDVSVAIFIKNTMQFAVKQGCRYAVTSQVMTGLGHDDSIKTVVKQNSMGFLNLLSPDHNGMDAVTIKYLDPHTLTELTGTGSNRGGNIVVISANGLSWAWMVPLLRSSAPLQFSVASADVMEASPLAGPPVRTTPPAH